MKRRDLIDRIGREAADQGIAWLFVRHGGDHDVHSLDGVRIPIPRHREIKELTALGIFKECESKLGRGWWKR